MGACAIIDFSSHRHSDELAETQARGLECAIIDIETRRRLDAAGAAASFTPTCEIVDYRGSQSDPNPFILFEAYLSKGQAGLLAAAFERVVAGYVAPKRFRASSLDSAAPRYEIVDELYGMKTDESPVVFDSIVTRRQAAKLAAAFKRICKAG
ncbi:MAG: hypothetical protein ACRC67_37685 [Inquilinus sp.]|uniref:hypothetical protein n=1 Tax=Inquilinus sp. TaxID=1932117 RepID=UPI003F3B6C06